VDTAPNWEPFNIVADPSHDHSIEMMREIPLSNFFDIAKGEYRMGVLGEHVVSDERYSDIAKMIEKKVTVKGKVESVNTSAVDTMELFMHFVIALQHISARVSELEGLVDKMVELNDTSYERIKEMDVNYSQLEHATGIRVEKEILLLNLDALKQIGHLEESRSTSLQEIEEVRYNESIKYYDAFHSELLEVLQQHKDTLLTMQVYHLETLQDIRLRDLVIEYDYDLIDNHLDQERLEQEFETSKTLFRDSRQLRAEQEAKHANINEELDTRVLQLEDQINREVTAELIETLFLMLFDFLRGLVEERDTLYEILRCFGTFAVGTVLFFEGLQVVQRITLSLLYGAKDVKWKKPTLSVRTMKKQLMRCSSSASNGKDSSLPSITEQVEAFKQFALAPEVSTQIKQLLLTYNASLQASSSARLNMPRLLLCGGAGNGKTSVASAIAAASGMHIAIVCGADLEALGPRASWYIQDVIRRCIRKGRKSSRPTMLVLDNMDGIIRRRSEASIPPATSAGVFGEADQSIIQPSGPGNQYLEACLYVLLQEMQESLYTFVTIITSSLRPTEIDEALLDRIDAFVELSPPSKDQRRHILLQQTCELLRKYLDVVELRELDRMSQRRSTVESDGRKDKTGMLSECFEATLRYSEGWCCRDICKLVYNIQSEVLSVEPRLLCQELWLKQLQLASREFERRRMSY
jgi:hypothetical protein